MLASCAKTVTHHRAMSYVTPHLITPSTGTPSLSPTLSFSHVPHPLLSEHKPCGDLRPHLSGALAELRPLTGYEPKQLAENPSSLLKTRNTGISPAEHEGLRVKLLSFHQQITASTYEQLRALLASPLYSREREESAENLISGSSQDPISTWKHVALFSSKKRLDQETLPIVRDFTFPSVC